MGYIFYFLIIASIIFGAINGTLSEVGNAVLSGAGTAVTLALSIIGIMAFWLGIMNIAQKSGLIAKITNLIRPITKWLFSDIPKDSKVMGDVAMSVSANVFGLTNAATPISIRVMKQLQKYNVNKASASNAMCMFLSMHTASFQLIPATVIAVLVATGYPNPTEIILPTLIVSTITFTSAILITKVLQKFWAKQKKGAK